MIGLKQLVLLKHGAPPRNVLEAALRAKWGGGGGASYEKTVGPAPIISISDAKAKPAKSLVVGMEPIQAGGGDPSPDNIRPITGRTGVTVTRTGKNLLNESADAFDIESQNYYQQYIPVPDGTVITMSLADKDTSVGISGAYLGAFVRNGDSTYEYSWLVTNGSITNHNLEITGKQYITVYPKSMLSTILQRFKIQVELGSTATAYEPYNGNTYPVTWQSEAGTVYGGTVDVVSGVLKVDMLLYDFGESAWNPVNNTETSRTQGLFISTLPNASKSVLNYSYTDIPNIISDTFKTQANLYFFDAGRNPGEATFSQYLKQLYVNWSALSGKTNEEAKAILTGIIACYELETPHTYQLTPTQIQLLKGSNTLWSDADDLTLTYIGTQPAGLLGGGFGGSWTPPADEPEEEEQVPEEEQAEESDPEEVVPDGE